MLPSCAIVTYPKVRCDPNFEGVETACVNYGYRNLRCRVAIFVG